MHFAQCDRIFKYQIQRYITVADYNDISKELAFLLKLDRNIN